MFPGEVLPAAEPVHVVLQESGELPEDPAGRTDIGHVLQGQADQDGRENGVGVFRDRAFAFTVLEALHLFVGAADGLRSEGRETTGGELPGL